MGRVIGVMAVSLALGAAGMYGLSHFTIRVEPIGQPSAPVRPQVPAEPTETRERLAIPDPGRGVVPAVAYVPHDPQPPAAPLALSAPPTTAAPTVLIPLAAAPDPPAKLPPTRITRVDITEPLDSKSLSWDVTSERTVSPHVLKGQAILQLADPPTGNAQTLAVTVNGEKTFTLLGNDLNDLKSKGIVPNDATSPTSLTVTLDSKYFKDGKMMIAVAAWPANKAVPADVLPTAPVVLVAPARADNPNGKGFAVNGTFNSPYLKDLTPSGPSSVFNGYLRVRGQAALPNPVVRFFVIRDGVSVGDY